MLDLFASSVTRGVAEQVIQELISKELSLFYLKSNKNILINKSGKNRLLSFYCKPSVC
jgi:hypothetical protein